MRELFGMPFWFLLAAALGAPVTSSASNRSVLLHACEAQVAGKFHRWRFAPVTPDVAEYAKDRHENPTITFGDFDGDGRKDVALLVQEGSSPQADYPARLDSLHIAVCLNQKHVTLLTIEKLYCGDGITLTPKGQRYYDFETDREGNYPLDGIHAYCFEKAGATYELRNGEFQKTVDSD